MKKKNEIEIHSLSAKESKHLISNRSKRSVLHDCLLPLLFIATISVTAPFFFEEQDSQQMGA